MNKKIIAYLTSGLLLFGAVTGLGVYQARAAETAAPSAQTDKAQQQKDAQDNYVSSVRTNNQQDTGEVEGQASEAAETGSLQALAKISADGASAAALKAVPGTATKVSLDNENGNVVYSVEVQTAKGSTDVKVDAGNGQVLAQDSEQDKENAQGKDTQEGDQGTGQDNVQLEQ